MYSYWGEEGKTITRRARVNEESYSVRRSSSYFCCVMYLVSRKVNHQAGIFNANSKTTSLLLCPNFSFYIQFGSLSTLTRRVSRKGTEGFGSCKFQISAISSAASEPRSRHRCGERKDARRSRGATSEGHYLAQPGPSAAPKKISRPSQTNPALHLSTHPKTTRMYEHRQPGHDWLRSEVRSTIAVSTSLLPAWGFGAAPASQ